MNTKEQKELEEQLRKTEESIENSKSEETLKSLKKLRVKGKVVGIVTTLVCPVAGIAYWIKLLNVEEERGDKLHDLVNQCLESMLSVAKGHMNKEDSETPSC